MTIILQLIAAAGKTSTLLEDAFLVVGALSAALESQFAPYATAFLPYLFPALKQHEDTQLCTIAVGIIGDIARALNEQTTQFSDSFMNVLFENLQNEVLNRDVKISILSCFGDIAMAIGPAFEPYMETTMGVLRQAGSVQPNPVRVPIVSPSCTVVDLLFYPSSMRIWWSMSAACVMVFWRPTQVSSLA